VLPFRAVADDAQGRVVVVGDGVEGVEKDVHVLVLDQTPGEEHVVALLREGRGANLLGVNAVRDDLDTVAVGADGCEAVGGDARDCDGVLWRSGGEVFGKLAEQGELAEVVVPVFAPDLVPGVDQWGVGADGGEFDGEDGEVRKDGGDDEVVFVVSEVFVQGVDGAGGEVERLGDGAAVVGVELCFGGYGTEGHSLVGSFGGGVPEVPAVDCYVVASVG